MERFLVILSANSCLVHFLGYLVITSSSSDQYLYFVSFCYCSVNVTLFVYGILYMGALR